MYSASSPSVICSPVEEKNLELNSEIYKGTHDKEIGLVERRAVEGYPSPFNSRIPKFPCKSGLGTQQN